MRIDDHVVFGCFESFEPSQQRHESALFALLPKSFAVEGDDLVERWVIGDRLREAVLDHPINFGIWKSLFESREHADGSTDIAQGAWSDQQNAFGIIHEGYCWRSIRSERLGGVDARCFFSFPCGHGVKFDPRGDESDRGGELLKADAGDVFD